MLCTGARHLVQYRFLVFVINLSSVSVFPFLYKPVGVAIVTTSRASTDREGAPPVALGRMELSKHAINSSLLVGTLPRVSVLSGC